MDRINCLSVPPKYRSEEPTNADGKEEKRCQLGKEIVDELDEELLAVDLETDLVYGAQAAGEIRHLVLGGIVGVDVGDAGDHFTEPFRQLAHVLDPLLGEQVHLALQFGDGVGLDGIKGEGREPKDRILDEHEDQDGEQGPPLEGDQGKGVAEEAAEGFGLGGDHGNDLAGRNGAEMGQGETQDAVDQLEAQAAQHAFRDHAPVDVDVKFEAAVDENHDEEYAAQRHQEGSLLEFDAKITLRETALSSYRLVDDDFRNLEGEIEKRE